MCWNEPVSWTTLAVGTVFSIILYQDGIKKNNNSIKAVAIMWQFTLLMQLFEALIHRDNGKCTMMGKVASHGAFWANILQPTIAIIVMIILGQRTFNQEQLIAMIIIAVYLGIFMYMYATRDFPCVGRDCHINLYWWDWSMALSILYFVGLFIVLYNFIPDIKVRNFTMIFLAVTLTMSLFYRQPTSIWCWFAAFGPLATLIYLHRSK